MRLLIRTADHGTIALVLRPDVAPVTVAHIQRLVHAKLFDGTSFYRSDFVIQCGLHGADQANPFPNLPVNETKVSNVRGTASIAHWDVPDNGNSEFFINIQDNKHLDTAYGGYCVFAQVEASDASSWAAISAIAAAIPRGTKPRIVSMTVE